jgi:hypothetical protein
VPALPVLLQDNERPAALRLRSRLCHPQFNQSCIKKHIYKMDSSMFRDFSFEAPAQHISAREIERTYSPFTPSPPPSTRPPTPPPCHINDLAYRLDQSSLQIEVDDHYTYYDGPRTPSDDYTFPTELDSPKHSSTLYTCLSSSTLRQQRQANQRAQCGLPRLEDIASLVQRMVEDGDQCRVREHKSKANSNASKSDEDEGVDMDYSPPPQEPHLYTLKFRRSGDRLNTGAVVSRSVKMRRRSGITKRSSK